MDKIEKTIKLNLGCGPHTPHGWINVDYWIGARFKKIPLLGRLGALLFRENWNSEIVIQNLIRPWKWESSSVDVIYTSHTLEHMWLEDGEFFMREAARVLKPNGLIRVVVPDLKALVNEYLRGGISSTDFMNRLHCFTHSRNERWYIKILAPYLRYPHRCMYDFESLSALLTQHGFRITHSSPSNSDIDDLKAIELPNRILDAITIEARKIP